MRTEHGPAWDDSRPIRGQAGWDGHAAFMDGLVDDGEIVLGGPLGDGAETLLIFATADENEIRARMATDPWAVMGLLRMGSIERWSIWLDRREGPGASR